MNLIAKINVKKKGKTNADIFLVDEGDSFLKSLFNVELSVSSKPEKAFVEWQISKKIGHNNFNLEIL